MLLVISSSSFCAFTIALPQSYKDVSILEAKLMQYFPKLMFFQYLRHKRLAELPYKDCFLPFSFPSLLRFLGTTEPENSSKKGQCVVGPLQVFVALLFL